MRRLPPWRRCWIRSSLPHNALSVFCAPACETSMRTRRILSRLGAHTYKRKRAITKTRTLTAGSGRPGRPFLRSPRWNQTSKWIQCGFQPTCRISVGSLARSERSGRRWQCGKEATGERVSRNGAIYAPQRRHGVPWHWNCTSLGHDRIRNCAEEEGGLSATFSSKRLGGGRGPPPDKQHQNRRHGCCQNACSGSC